MRYVLACLTLLSTPAMAREQLQPPTLFAPVRGPDPSVCVPHDQKSVELNWEREGDASDPVTYRVEVRRYSNGDWKPWVSKIAKPPFTLYMRPVMHGTMMSWRVVAIDPTGQADPPEVPSSWWEFCVE